MPRVLQPISALIPLTYFLTIARGVMLKDAGMGILFKDFLALLAFSIIFISVSTIRLKKTVD
jgi:ABC-2 type transport system permease protein